MLRRLIHKRDFYAGGMLILFGLLAALKGPDYGPGTLVAGQHDVWDVVVQDHFGAVATHTLDFHLV